ncbi:TPA: DUF4435 domain-containing protein [Klebsiella michiganensis]
MSDNTLDILDSLRKAQLTKDSLMQTVLMALSTFDKVIVFEGDTDYQVYDEWLKHNPVYTSSEHVCAKGKSQLIELYEHAKNINHSDIINGCRFFVDHDYDLFSHNDDFITTLNCYSVENYLVNDSALLNILKDEFHLDARRHNERLAIIVQFRKDLSMFNELAKKVCMPLFVKHNLEGKTEFYRKISDLIIIEYSNVRLKDEASSIIPTFDESSDAVQLVRQFNALPYIRTIRGKYHFEFVKKWLVSLRTLINNEGLHNIPKVNKDPEQMDMRRFASATPVPTELSTSVCLRRV